MTEPLAVVVPSILVGMAGIVFAGLTFIRRNDLAVKGARALGAAGITLSHRGIATLGRVNLVAAIAVFLIGSDILVRGIA